MKEGWTQRKFKHLYKEYSDAGHENEELLSVFLNRGVIKYSESNGMQVHKPSESLEKYQLVLPGCLVLNNQQAWRGSVGVSAYRGIVSPAYHVYTPFDDGLDSRCMNYLARSAMVPTFELCSHGVGSIQRILSKTELANSDVLLPPFGEQHRIADYLDAKCTEIDAAVDSAQASIDELMTYRTAMLNQTMDAASHDARPVKLKYLLKESKDRSADGKGEPLSITIARGVLKSSELNVPNPISTLVGAKVVHAGDLVFNKLKARHGVMYVSPYDGLISSEYAIYQAFDDHVVSLRYLEYLCHTTGMIDEFIIRTSGVAEGFRRLYTTDLFDITINLPERSAQEAVVNILDTLYGAIADSIHAKQSIIDDLKAYKQSLIYEVVTGKREV